MKVRNRLSIIFCLLIGLFSLVVAISAEPWPDADPSGPWVGADASGPWTPTPAASATAVPSPTSIDTRPMMTTATPTAIAPAVEMPNDGPASYGLTENLLLHYTFDDIEGNKVKSQRGQSLFTIGDVSPTNGIIGRGVHLGVDGILQSEQKITLPRTYALSAWVRPSGDTGFHELVVQNGFTNLGPCTDWASGAGITLRYLTNATTSALAYLTCQPNQVRPDIFNRIEPIDPNDWIFVTISAEFQPSTSPHRADRIFYEYYLNANRISFEFVDPAEQPPLNEFLRFLGIGFDIDEIKLFNSNLSKSQITNEYATMQLLERDQLVQARKGETPQLPRPHNIVDTFKFESDNLTTNLTNPGNMLTESPAPVFWPVGGVSGTGLHIESGSFSIQKGRVGLVDADYTLSFWVQEGDTNAERTHLSLETREFSHNTSSSLCRNNCPSIPVDSITTLRLSASPTTAFINYSTGVSAEFSTPLVYDANAPIEAGSWHHIVVTPNKLYINGAPVLKIDAYTNTSKELYWYENSLLRIFGNNYNIDEMLVYSVLLTDDEVLDLYLLNSQ